MTWEGAQEFCNGQTATVRIDHSTAHTSPSHLVEVNTEDIQKFVVEGKAKGRVYWIGARDNDEVTINDATDNGFKESSLILQTRNHIVLNSQSIYQHQFVKTHFPRFRSNRDRISLFSS